MSFDETLARSVAFQYCSDENEEQGLVNSFVQICQFLFDNPDRLSWGSRAAPSVETEDGLRKLAQRYYSVYRRSDIPGMPRTVPDEIASLVIMEVFGYSEQEALRIKVEHQKAMIAENCVGALLERYLDAVLRAAGWHWCCGGFVKAVDFIAKDAKDLWIAVQIKNRDNSENSSSSAIRNGTTIKPWFRTFSRTGQTNWHNLPPLMQGFGLSEQGFADFVRGYIRKNMPKP